MTEEIYKNGDIYYIKTLLGEIKMFDKDDSEINWTPTQNLNDKVIFYNQAYINEQTKRLEQENKELKHRNENLRIALSTYEMPEVVKVLTDYRTGELQLQEKRLNKYRSALEEIKTVLKFYADTWVDEKMYPNLHYDNTKAKEGLSRINEVLNDN